MGYEKTVELKPGDIAITDTGTIVNIAKVGVDWCKAIVANGINKGMEVEIKLDRLTRLTRLTMENNRPAILPCFDSTCKSYLLNIKRVIFNPPATIVLWDDGTKTVVKCHNEPFDKEKGLAMALLRAKHGSGIRKLFKKWCADGKDET